MGLKRRFYIKQKIISVLVVFSIIAFGGIMYISDRSGNQDNRYVELVELSEKVEIEVFSGRIIIDELTHSVDKKSETKIYESFNDTRRYIGDIKKLREESAKINSEKEELLDRQLELLASEVLQLERTIREELKKESGLNGSQLISAYRSFLATFEAYENALYSYIIDSNNRLKNEILTLLVIIFIILVLSLILVVRLMNTLLKTHRKLLRNTMEVEQRERKRIAMDLHDGLGAMLSSVGLYSKLLQKEFKEDEAAHSKLVQITNLSRQALQTVGEVINDLNPSVLNRYNIVEALDRLKDKVNNIGEVHLNIDCSDFSGAMAKSREIIIYRICSELVNNTLKHAHATEATIRLSRQNSVVLEYSDNGLGFDYARTDGEEGKGRGIDNIIDRVKSIDGDCDIFTAPGEGFSIVINLSIDK
ncbi:hypothetical protein EYV94_01640 [Puteibacter caeruleilacunae]|nr:hypothetical protein EYV94_01640 [Puteibacter caeruleilacunae]